MGCLALALSLLRFSFFSFLLRFSFFRFLSLPPRLSFLSFLPRLERSRLRLRFLLLPFRRLRSSPLLLPLSLLSSEPLPESEPEPEPLASEPLPSDCARRRFSSLPLCSAIWCRRRSLCSLDSSSTLATCGGQRFAAPQEGRDVLCC